MPTLHHRDPRALLGKKMSSLTEQNRSSRTYP